ncbi:DUF883 family protein [Niveibacterium sp. SC-1]|uniref:DUF883 family protein n=1 Tax=Niveibacterium sp. SC-1 TaxID=3135646 RepID=UPI00311F1BF4
MSEVTQAGRDKMVADVKVLISDAEELLKLTAGEASGKLAEVRTRLGERVAAAKVRVVEMEQALVAKTKEAAKATDVYVHENPWKSVGIAAGAGLLIGLLIGRR